MTHTRNDEKEKAVFHAARSIQNLAQRETYLKAACGDDRRLRTQVDSLLAAVNAAGDFLESPPLDSHEKGAPHAIDKVAGTKIGPFKLLEKIGEGGFGVVYMADQVEPIRRRLALKIIKAGMDTKQVVARFEAERQALALMEHPNIAKVLDAGATVSGRPYFVMELVRGVPIIEYCDQRSLTTEERLTIFIDICSAIQHAHQKGIIHRDIKPSNILVSTDADLPVPKVIDFGIAKATQGNLTDKTLFTQFRQFVGTPAYMSPEQAQMSTVDVDTRSDVDSLGVLLYELLTGKTPFDSKELMKADFEEVCRRIREEEAPTPSKRVSSLEVLERTSLASSRGLDASSFQARLRGDLDWIVMKAVDKDRRRRYDSASGFAADVQRCLQQEPVAAVPPSVTYKVHKFIRRNRRAVWMAAAIATSLLGGTVVATVGMLRAIGANSELAIQVWETRAALNRAETETKRASVAESTALQTAYLADMQAAHQALALNNLGLARQILNNSRYYDADNDPRNWEWRALWLQCHGESKQAFNLSDYVGSVSVSHDGEWAAAALGYGRIHSWNIHDHEISKTLMEKAVNEPSAAVAFSPTGNRLFGTADEEGVIRSWEIPTFVESNTTLPVGTRVSQICVSRDGKLLAALGYDGLVSVWELTTGKELKRFQGGRIGGAHSGGLAISNDSSKLALGLHRKIRVVDLGTFKDLYVIEQSGRDGVEFSPNGKWIATNAGFLDKLIHVRNVSDGKVVTQLRGHSLSVTDFAFSPDGKLLASASADQTVRLWDTETWQEAKVLRGHRTIINSLAFASNGKQLVSGSEGGGICVWKTDVAAPSTWPISKEDVFPLATHRFPPQLLATFSPDGKLLATLNRDRGVTLLSAETLEVARTMPEAGSEPRGVRFSPTDNLLAVGYMDGSLALFDSYERTEVARVVIQSGAEICPVRFTSDGSRLLVVALGEKETHCVIYSIEDRREMVAWTVPSDLLHAVLSPNGETVVTRHRDDSENYIWSVKDTANPTIFHMQGEELDFSPDGQHLAVDAGPGGLVAIVDVTTCTTVGHLIGHKHRVASLQFSPDGKRIATGAHDVESVKVGDFATRRELLTLETTGWYHRQVEWSPDGNSILLMGDSGKLSLWRVPTMEQIQAED